MVIIISIRKLIAAGNDKAVNAPILFSMRDEGKQSITQLHISIYLVRKGGLNMYTMNSMASMLHFSIYLSYNLVRKQNILPSMKEFNNHLYYGLRTDAKCIKLQLVASL